GEFHVLTSEVAGQGSRQRDGTLVSFRRNFARLGIVENNAQPALILARELPHFQRSGFRRGFPVHRARHIVRRVFANTVKLSSAAAHEGDKLAGNQRQNIQQLFGLEQRRVHNQFALQRNRTALGQKRKWETRGNTKTILAVLSASRES